MSGLLEQVGGYLGHLPHHLQRVNPTVAKQFLADLQLPSLLSHVKGIESFSFLYSVVVLAIFVIALRIRSQIYLLLRFVWSCFLAPIGHGAAQKDRLDKFYGSQAEIYDATRGRLLKGREEMLRLTASHLKDQLERGEWSGKKLVWVDVGGGTGYNIEKMSEYIDIGLFHAVFLIDLCE